MSYWCLKSETASRRFQPGEGPSRGHLLDCEIFANLCFTFVSSSSVQVSWLRWADMSVLTVGGLVFSSDPRLVVTAARLGPATLAWKLYISEVSPADSGDYQCQINTEPKQSLDVTLMVSGVSIEIFNSMNIKFN